MSNVNAKEQLTIQLAQSGFIGPKAEEEIEKIVAAIPEATRGNYPEDKYEAALAFLPAYQAQMGTQSETPVAVQPQQESAPAVVSAAQAKAIQAVMAEGKAAKEERTAKTTIEKLLIDKPAPSTYLKADQTVVPTCKAENIEKYEKMLDREDPENVANFEKLMAAVKNKTALPIYINAGQNKVVGYKISTPSGEAGKDNLVQKTLTSEAMLGFVTTELDGYIPTKGDGLGVKLRWNNPRKGRKVTSKRTTGAPSLVIGNKKEALKNSNSHEIISKVDMNGDQVVTKPGKLRTALSFRIATGDTKTNGEKIYRTIRLSGDAQVPKFTRTTEEYTKLFGASDKDRGAINPPTPAEAAALEEAMVNTIAFMVSNGASKYNISSFQDKFAQATSNASAPTDGMEL